jgi:hypothetical protein
MNSGRMESSVGPDRLATQEEVRCAMSRASANALEFAGLYDDFSEMVSDASGRASSLREEIEWLMIARETRDCISN